MAVRALTRWPVRHGRGRATAVVFGERCLPCISALLFLSLPLVRSSHTRPRRLRRRTRRNLRPDSLRPRSLRPRSLRPRRLRPRSLLPRSLLPHRLPPRSPFLCPRTYRLRRSHRTRPCIRRVVRCQRASRSSVRQRCRSCATRHLDARATPCRRPQTRDRRMPAPPATNRSRLRRSDGAAIGISLELCHRVDAGHLTLDDSLWRRPVYAG